MKSIELNREEVVAKLHELRSREKTADFFGVAKSTLRRRLDEWNVEVLFHGRNAKLPWHRPKLEDPKIFNPDDIALWVPLMPRVGFHGLPIASEPVKVRVISKRTPKGMYRCEVVDSKFRIQLRKTEHNVSEHALKEINE